MENGWEDVRQQVLGDAMLLQAEAELLGEDPTETGELRTLTAELVMRAEVRQLRRANGILQAAAGFFAAELDRPQR